MAEPMDIGDPPAPPKNPYFPVPTVLAPDVQRAIEAKRKDTVYTAAAALAVEDRARTGAPLNYQEAMAEELRRIRENPEDEDVYEQKFSKRHGRESLALIRGGPADANDERPIPLTRKSNADVMAQVGGPWSTTAALMGIYLMGVDAACRTVVVPDGAPLPQAPGAAVRPTDAPSRMS